MKPQIPNSIKLEHQKLHKQLKNALNAGGIISEKAKVIENFLHSHFIKEEEIALPPLGILSKLFETDTQLYYEDVIKMSDELKKSLLHMINEHESIVSALEEFEKIAKEEGRIDLVEFAENLKLHATMEEEILYPTAILIGEYLKLKSLNQKRGE